MEQPETQDSAVATAAPEQPTQQAPELDLTDALESQQAEDEDEQEEDLDGVKVRGKKEAIEKLKAERLMQADYTRKTQAAAEQVKAVEAERQAINQLRQTHQTHIEVVANLVALDKQIAQFQNLDWNALSDSDPVQAQKLDRQLRTLQERKGQGLQMFAQLQQQEALRQQNESRSAVEKAADYLRREIPNWSPERDTKLKEYAVAQGVPANALSDLVIKAPALGKVFHKAELYDQLLAKHSTKPKPEAQAEPVTRITSTRASANKDPDKMPMNDWLKWREAQIKRR